MTPLPLAGVAELVEHRARFRARARSKGASRISLTFEGLYPADLAGLAARFPIGASVLDGNGTVVYNHTAAMLVLAEVAAFLSPEKRAELDAVLVRLDAINLARARPGRRRRVASA